MFLTNIFLQWKNINENLDVKDIFRSNHLKMNLTKFLEVADCVKSVRIWS